jgi:hypothetical protein
MDPVKLGRAVKSAENVLDKGAEGIHKVSSLGLGAGIVGTAVSSGNIKAAVPAVASGIKRLGRYVSSKDSRECGTGDSPGEVLCRHRAQHAKIKSRFDAIMNQLHSCKDNRCKSKLTKLAKNEKVKMMYLERRMNSVAESIIAQRKERVHELLTEGPFAGMVRTGLASLGGSLVGDITSNIADRAVGGVWNSASNMMSKSGRMCKAYQGPMRELCKSRYELNFLEAKYADLEMKLQKCRSKFLGSGRCEEKIQTIMNKVMLRMQVSNDNINFYRQAAVSAAREHMG